tara:strand:+ start:307 stop:498 length:192 start_codon:yes stop_codon:yes gene_type:complete
MKVGDLVKVRGRNSVFPRRKDGIGIVIAIDPCNGENYTRVEAIFPATGWIQWFPHEALVAVCK